MPWIWGYGAITEMITDDPEWEEAYVERIEDGGKDKTIHP